MSFYFALTLLSILLVRFLSFGGRVPYRPVEDLAFAVARFFQRGGTFQNYYMVIIWTWIFKHVSIRSLLDYYVDISSLLAFLVFFFKFFISIMEEPTLDAHLEDHLLPQAMTMMLQLMSTVNSWSLNSLFYKKFSFQGLAFILDSFNFSILQGMNWHDCIQVYTDWDWPGGEVLIRTAVIVWACSIKILGMSCWGQQLILVIKCWERLVGERKGRWYSEGTIIILKWWRMQCSVQMVKEVHKADSR